MVFHVICDGTLLDTVLINPEKPYGKKVTQVGSYWEDFGEELIKSLSKEEVIEQLLLSFDKKKNKNVLSITLNGEVIQ